jgi:Predicted DNA alkylation repair enzyme
MTPGVSARRDAVLAELHEAADPTRTPGMARVGINIDRAIGVKIPDCRRIAGPKLGDHALALALWKTGIHEARITAAMIDRPEDVTDDQMDAWVDAFDSWDLCDQVCLNLFSKTASALSTARRWCARDEEFVKRAGYVMIAERAVSGVGVSDAELMRQLPLIRRGATDERNYVKRAVSWALRQIGKRNTSLNQAAIEEAERIAALDTRSARWVANDALRELRSDEVQATLRAKG